MKKENNKGIVLLSGGIDSAVTLYLARKYGYHLIALIFDYGQRHHKEIESAKRIARFNRIPYKIIPIRLDWTPSSLTQKGQRVPFNRDLRSKKVPSTYVPGRNIIFLSYAVSLAESSDAGAVFIGAHVQDYSGYPDCRGEFLSSFEFAANKGLHHRGIRIIAPLIDKSKKEIVKLGADLGVPLDLTWSCYLGRAKPCMKCDSCRYRAQAFSQLNMKDPLLQPKAHDRSKSS